MHTILTMHATVKYPRPGERYVALIEDGDKHSWTLPLTTLLSADWLEVFEP